MRGTQFAELNVFAAVAEQASFTRAARQLGMSTASVSQAVGSLEDRLGVRLLNRTTRSVSLTEAGEQVLAHLRPLLDHFDALIESVNTFRDNPSGRLRLTVPPPVARMLLAPLLPRFLCQYPQIRIEIDVNPKQTDIVESHFDAGIRAGHKIARGMTAVRITDEIPRVVVAAPAYLARHRAPQVPDDLRGHDCIRIQLPGGDFLPWEFVTDGKTIAYPVTGSLVVNDPELAVSAALEGIGLASVAEDYVRGLISDARLMPVLDGLAAPSAPFFLYYPSGRHNPAALQVLIDFLSANWRASAGSTPAAADPVVASPRR